MVDAERCAGVVSIAARRVVGWMEWVVVHLGGAQNLVVVAPSGDSVDGCCHRGSAEAVVCMPVELRREVVWSW